MVIDFDVSCYARAHGGLLLENGNPAKGRFSILMFWQILQIASTSKSISVPFLHGRSNVSSNASRSDSRFAATDDRLVDCQTNIEAVFCGERSHVQRCNQDNELGSFIRRKCPQLCGLCRAGPHVTSTSVQSTSSRGGDILSTFIGMFQSSAARSNTNELSSAAKGQVQRLINERVGVLELGGALARNNSFARQVTNEVAVLQNFLQGTLMLLVRDRCGSSTAVVPSVLQQNVLPRLCAESMVAMMTLVQSNQNAKWPGEQANGPGLDSLPRLTSLPDVAEETLDSVSRADWNVSAAPQQTTETESSFDFVYLPIILVGVLVMCMCCCLYYNNTWRKGPRYRRGATVRKRKFNISETGSVDFDPTLAARIDKNIERLKRTRLNMKPSLGIEWDHSADSPCYSRPKGDGIYDFCYDRHGLPHDGTNDQRQTGDGLDFEYAICSAQPADVDVDAVETHHRDVDPEIYFHVSVVVGPLPLYTALGCVFRPLQCVLQSLSCVSLNCLLPVHFFSLFSLFFFGF